MNIQKEKDVFYIGTPEKKDAYITFTEKDGVLTIEHTIVPEALKGQGIGSVLVKEVADYVREKGEKVNASCWFADKILKDNPEYEDIYKKEQE